MRTTAELRRRLALLRFVESSDVASATTALLRDLIEEVLWIRGEREDASMANITIKQGDDISRRLTITDSAGAAVDLTGATLTFHLRRLGGTADAIAGPPTLTVEPPATAGIATLALTKAQTEALLGDTVYQYEIEAADASGKVSTLVEGYVLVEVDRG
jgi:Ca2+-binding RTX toxin-like protein